MLLLLILLLSLLRCLLGCLLGLLCRKALLLLPLQVLVDAGASKVGPWRSLLLLLRLHLLLLLRLRGLPCWRPCDQLAPGSRRCSKARCRAGCCHTRRRACIHGAQDRWPHRRDSCPCCGCCARAAGRSRVCHMLTRCSLCRRLCLCSSSCRTRPRCGEVIGAFVRRGGRCLGWPAGCSLAQQRCHRGAAGCIGAGQAALVGLAAGGDVCS